MTLSLVSAERRPSHLSLLKMTASDDSWATSPYSFQRLSLGPGNGKGQGLVGGGGMPASPLLMEINEVTQLLQDRRGELRCINEGPGGGRGTSHQEAALLCPFSHLRQPRPACSDTWCCCWPWGCWLGSCCRGPRPGQHPME